MTVHRPQAPVLLIKTLLMSPEKRRLEKNVDRLVNLHMKETGTTTPGFIYAGRVFRRSDFLRGKLGFSSLATSLEHEAERHLEDERSIEEQMQQITQSLGPALRPCVTLQDIRDVLPDCIGALFSNLERLTRTREPGWTLEPGSRAHRQFHKILPLIEAQAAARLLY